MQVETGGVDLRTVTAAAFGRQQRQNIAFELRYGGGCGTNGAKEKQPNARSPGKSHYYHDSSNRKRSARLSGLLSKCLDEFSRAGRQVDILPAPEICRRPRQLAEIQESRRRA